MSRQPINRSPDLQRLRDEGYNIRHVHGHLVVWDVPYLDAARALQRGALISAVAQRDDVAIARDDHRLLRQPQGRAEVALRSCNQQGRQSHL